MPETNYRLILSIDGGGIKGTIPAYFLYQLEELSQCRIVDKFDMMFGTSTGGIIINGLTTKNDEGEYKLSAKDVLDLYMDNADKIFYESDIRYNPNMNWFQKIRKGIKTALDYVTDERYDNKPMLDILKNYHGEELHYETGPTAVVATSYDMRLGEPFFIKNYDKRINQKIKTWEATYATSAAPTYFKPFSFKNANQERVLVDGGLFANDPSMCAYTEAKKLYPNEEFIIVSIGTGIHHEYNSYKKLDNFIDVQWIQPIIKHLMQGPNKATEHHLFNLKKADPYFIDYYRFNVNLEGKLISKMDNGHMSNMKNLCKYGDKMISSTSETNDKNVNHLIQLLRSNKDIFDRKNIFK